MQQKLQLDLHW